MKKPYILETSCWLPTSVEDTFAFFQDARNLQQITPSYLDFRILPPIPDSIRQGSLINYKLKLYHLPFHWQTEIHLWEPPLRFMDRQLRGPYLQWEHTHTFEACDGGTRMTDRVQYRIPGWILAPLIHTLLVRRNVENIFAYRNQQIFSLFGGSTGPSSAPSTL